MFASASAVAFVEDDEILRAANTQSLELAGFEVSTFSNGREALAAIGPDFAGVVITDIRMPDMDGRQLFHRLRALDESAAVMSVGE